MMSSDKIENLNELIQQYAEKETKIVASKISRLTAPGENFGGVLLQVDLTLENKNGSREELHAVAKLLPTNEFLRIVFNIQVTCKKEIAFYDTVVPTLQRFQKDHGVDKVVDFFPKKYAARINLDGSDKVDDNSVIMLENLIHTGHKNIDRLKGFDLETTKLILQDLAAFHATSLALKLLNPEVFEKHIKFHLENAISPPPPPENSTEKGGPYPLLLDLLENSEECKSVMGLLRKNLERQGHREGPEQPFWTIVHGDMWVNNIMIKFQKKKPVGCKFVDFQNCLYGSPADDLFFFLWSSVQKTVLAESLDELITFYHEKFIKELEKYNCEISIFSFDKLSDDLIEASKFEIAHVLFMTVFVVYGRKGGFASDTDPTKLPDFGTKEDIHPEAKEKVFHMIDICSKRGWIG